MKYYNLDTGKAVKIPENIVFILSKEDVLNWIVETDDLEEIAEIFEECIEVLVDNSYENLKGRLVKYNILKKCQS